MTLVFYFITAWLTYKIARLFCEPPFALAGVILLLGNQAFLFDLLPWPSAVAMPLITLVSFLLLRKLSRVENSPNRSALEVVTIGIIIPMVILTRVQIGFILFVISLIFIFFFGSKKETAIFFLSFLTSIGIFFGYLSSNGWLVSSLQDQLLFGSSYLGSDTNPIPIFTSIGVFTVVLFFALSDKLMIKVNNTREKSRIVIIAICLFLILMLVAITIMARRLMNPFSMYVLVVHRIWISVILGAIIYFTLVQIKKSYEAWQMHSFFDRDLQVKNLLALLSITSQLQIYPLFDQMHSWWGSTPGVVVILLIYKEKYQVADILVSQEKRLAKSMVVATLVLTLLPYAIQTMNLGKIVSSPYLGGIFVPQNSADEILTLQSTFEKNLSPGASVLNLCSDPDIFLNSKYPNSESRIFIFWPEFLKIEYLRKTFQESSPQWIVSCFPESRKAEDLKIFQEYVNEGSSNFVLVHSVRNLLGRDWQIWKK
jgi:hypothetical protein